MLCKASSKGEVCDENVRVASLDVDIELMYLCENCHRYVWCARFILDFPASSVLPRVLCNSLIQSEGAAISVRLRDQGP